MKKKAISLLFCTMLAMMLFVISVQAKPVFDGWNTAGWTKSTEGNSDVFSGENGKTFNFMKHNNASSCGYVTVDIKIASNYATIDGNVGVSYQLAGGGELFFEYNTVYHYLKLRRIESNGAQTTLAHVDKTLSESEWIHFSVGVTDNRLQWYVDNECIYDASHSYRDLSNGNFLVQGYYSTPKLRRLYFSAQSEPDFEFEEPMSVRSFTAQNGKLSQKDGELVYEITGNQSYIQSMIFSPDHGTAYGTDYFARLTIKNTILMHVRNDSDATALKVYFKTKEDPSYSESKSKIVSITPHSDREPIYCNFSDLSSGLGELREFRIMPIGASSGTIYIEAITFEREKNLYDYAGNIDSCLADGETVTITGSLDAAYAGKKVSIYEIEVSNWEESFAGLTPIAETVANGNTFSVSLPFYNGKLTRLSSLFLAVVDGKKISDRFTIENYRDFEPNPYAFTLPDRKVSVLDFGAVGDAFTNDTAAIQKAIDYVSAQGGGQVIVPGDDTLYGKRYVITCVRLKDNVDLHLEKGAVLWQSSRPEEYDYAVAYGHDVEIPGINWTHAGLCHNYPLIYANRASNIKLTGEGVIRSADNGSDNLDGVGGALWVGCASRIHLIPIGLFACKGVEISDFTMKRTNAYHMALLRCEDICVQNVTMHEVTCASGDGFSMPVKRGLINRCFLFSNDDAITLSSNYNEPRGLVWWEATPNNDNCVEDIRIVHNNLYGGHGVTFITWGTDNPDLSRQEIKGITVMDCVLGGNSAGIGTWPDNPYYGKQPYDNSETNDFSPVKDVYIANNRYTNVVDLLCLRPTNLWSDCGLKSTSTFENANFERQNGRAGWVSGLSNWSHEKQADEALASFVTQGSNHAAELKGKIFFYQGLYRESGTHAFSIDVTALSGNAQLLVTYATTGRAVACMPITGTGRHTLTFKISTPSLMKIGIQLTDSASFAIVDNAAVSKTAAYQYPKYFVEDFEEDDLALDVGGWLVSEEKGNQFIQMPAGNNGLLRLPLSNTYTNFDASFMFRIDAAHSTIDGNIGFIFQKQGDNRIFSEYNTAGHYWRVRQYHNGAERELAYITAPRLAVGEWHKWSVRAQNGICKMYIDNTELCSFSYTVLSGGIISLSTYQTNVSVDDFCVVEPHELYMGQNQAHWFKEWMNGAQVNGAYGDAWTLTKEDGNGILKTNGSQNGVLSFSAPSIYGDMDTEVRFRIDTVLSSVDANIGFITNYRSDENHMFIEYNPVGHYLLARQYIGGQAVSLQSVRDFTLSWNTWHTMGLRFVGDNAELYVDGEQVMTFKTLSMPSQGSYRISSYNMSVSLDYVSIMPPYTMALSHHADAPYAETEISEQGGMLNLRTVLRGAENANSRCVTAAYAEDGRLIQASAQEGIGPFDTVLPKDADHVDVFVWDMEGIAPKTRKETLPRN